METWPVSSSMSCGALNAEDWDVRYQVSCTFLAQQL